MNINANRLVVRASLKRVDGKEAILFYAKWLKGKVNGGTLCDAQWFFFFH